MATATSAVPAKIDFGRFCQVHAELLCVAAFRSATNKVSKLKRTKRYGDKTKIKREKNHSIYLKLNHNRLIAGAFTVCLASDLIAIAFTSTSFHSFSFIFLAYFFPLLP